MPVGKVIGGIIGFALGGLGGSIIGLMIGHYLVDSRIRSVRINQTKSAFFTATFSVMGHVAKADGRVSPEEIQMAESIIHSFGLDLKAQSTAKHLFYQGKKEDFDLASTLENLRREIRLRPTLLRIFLEVQVTAALADGDIAPTERKLLLYISQKLGIPAFVFNQIEQSIKARMYSYGTSDGSPASNVTKIENAYATLELQPDVSMAQIKQAYRRLINRNHPDKLIAKGLPEQMIRVATEKSQKIREAYEVLQEHRAAGGGELH